MTEQKKILVAGGSGFIGSNFIRMVLNNYPNYRIINLDNLSYGRELHNLKDMANHHNYTFIKGDIRDREMVENIMKNVDYVINFAAEVHVDRSIADADIFVKTDVLGTCILLDVAREFKIKRFIQISTDEVYGSIGKGSFKETHALNPSNPYSASKAGGDMIVLAYHTTFGLPTIITRSTNNFGPFQHVSAIIPKFITNALRNKKLGIYGDGTNQRDWMFVMDHCNAIDLVFHEGKVGQIYNISCENHRTNNEITKIILENLGKPKSLIKYVEDRPGHDKRYAIDSSKIRKLGWKPQHKFEESMKETIQWFKDNEWWWKPLVN